MSFPSYPKYKDSGAEWLPDLPSHWVISRFKLVFKERSERSKDGSEELLSVSAYYGVKPRASTLDDGEHLSRAESLEGYKICEPGDLVMNIMLAWNRGLGFAWQRGIVSPAYCVFSVKSDADARYLDYLVRSNECTTYFKAFSSGVIDSRLRLYPEMFGSLYCALPPTDEQQQIATFLDHETAKIDALVEEQKRLIKLLKEKRQAVISQAVTKGLDPNVPMKDSGVEWLGEVPAHWRVTRAKFVSQIFVPQRSKPDLNDSEGFPWVTMENMGQLSVRPSKQFVSNEALKAAGSKVLPEDSVIASCVGSFGVASINRADVVINQQLQAFQPRKIKAEYLRELVTVSKPYFEKIGTAATLIYVNQQGFESLPLPLPPEDEQDSICRHVACIVQTLQKLLDEAMLTINLLNERRSALISAAVTGKIDVRHA